MDESAAAKPIAPVKADPDSIRKDAVHQHLSNTDSTLKDLLADDASGGLFDSISWLLMNSGSLDFTSAPDQNIFVSMKASSDALEQSLLSSSMQALINEDVSVNGSWNSFSFDQIAARMNSNSHAAGEQTHNGGASAATSSNSTPSISKPAHAHALRHQIPHEVIVTALNDDSDEDSDTISDTKSARKRTGSPLGTGRDGEPKKKRQRERVQDLEDRAKMLLAENAELRSHIQDLSTRSVDMEKQKSDMLNSLAERVANGDTGSPELIALLKKYGELFAEYGAARQKEVGFHLSQLKRLILPTQTTKMCMWTLQQDKSFYQSSKSPLWNILSTELGMTAEQAAKIQTHRQRVLELLEKLQESLDLTDSLHDSIQRRHQTFEACLNALQTIISPKQTVQFLLWVRKFGHLLPQTTPLINTGAVAGLCSSSASAVTASTATATSSSSAASEHHTSSNGTAGTNSRKRTANGGSHA